MKKYISFLSTTELFRDFSPDEILHTIDYFKFFLKDFKSNESIYSAGTKIIYPGLILDGNVDIIHQSAHGNENIVNRLGAGQLFGESFSYSGQTNYFSDIRSLNQSKILFINIPLLLEENRNNIYYQKLFKNYLYVIACNNITLNTKIQLLTQKTLREKLYSYFTLIANETGSLTFELPFNREQLACFLFSERSSVSRELNGMQKEGIIHISKNYITLYK